MMVLQDFKNDLLTLHVEECQDQSGEIIRVHWLGRASMRDPSNELGSFFTAIEERAISSKKSVVFDFTKLDHFNSSTIVAVMRMIRRLDHKMIPFTLIYSQKLKWQSMTFDALKQFQGPDRLLHLHGH